MMAILHSTAASERRRAKAKLKRQAAHDERRATFEARCNDPLTKEVAFSICCSVYGARSCACEKRPDMAVCSTMVGAALSAIRLVSRSSDPGQ